jgi:hypothetical protein
MFKMATATVTALPGANTTTNDKPKDPTAALRAAVAGRKAAVVKRW